MKPEQLRYEQFSIAVASGWQDITATLEDGEAPITVADPVSGKGAMQISLATHKAGPVPHITIDDLRGLLSEFAVHRHLGSAFDERTSDDGLSIIGQSYQTGDDFIRVWYATDGRSLALITYVCDWHQREAEAEIVAATVQSLRFRKESPR